MRAEEFTELNMKCGRLIWIGLRRPRAGRPDKSSATKGAKVFFNTSFRF